MFRFYDPDSGEEFFTDSEIEAKKLVVYFKTEVGNTAAYYERVETDGTN